MPSLAPRTAALSHPIRSLRCRSRCAMVQLCLCSRRFDAFFSRRARPSGGRMPLVLRLGLLLSAAILLPMAATAADDPLVRAAQAGDVAAIRALITRGHDVDAAGPDGATALHWAVRGDDLATVDALIRAGARVSVTNALGVPPAYVAAQNGNAAVDRKSTRLNSSHSSISYAVFCLK